MGQIHLYTICWNEEFMLPYFFQYYDQLVDRYVIFDDGSNDASHAIIQSNPKAELRKLPRIEADSYIISAKHVHDTCWKESIGKADWVIITAIDEFLYHKELKSYLSNCQGKGITALPALGFQMISEIKPVAGISMEKQITRGCPWSKMNKLSVFNPNAILSTEHAYGRHSAMPTGKVVFAEKDELLNLHYKYINKELTFNRHLELNEKLGSIDKQNNWGHQYGFEREKFEKTWAEFDAKALENVLDEKYIPHDLHSPLEDRWWRRRKPTLIERIKKKISNW